MGLKPALLTRGKEKKRGYDEARKSTMANRAQIPSLSIDHWKQMGYVDSEFYKLFEQIDTAELEFKQRNRIGTFGSYQYPDLLPTPTMISLAKALSFFSHIDGDAREFLKKLNHEFSISPITSDFIYGYGTNGQITNVINSPRENASQVIEFYRNAADRNLEAYTLYGHTEVVLEGDELLFLPKIRIVKLGKYNHANQAAISEIVNKNAFKIAGGIDSYDGYELGLFGDKSFVFEVTDVSFGKLKQKEVEELLMGNEEKKQQSEDNKTEEVDLKTSFPEISDLQGKLYHLLMAGV